MDNLDSQLIILNEEPRSITTRQRRVKVRCVCGTEFVTYLHHVKSGATKSCGRHRLQEDGTFKILPEKEKEFHHKSNSPAYKSYQSMKDRCYNPENKDYLDYGGRGITVHQEWLDSFKAFIDHIGERPPDTTIDRINVNESYIPGNVRWATTKVQNSNKRSKTLTKLQRIFGQVK